MIFDPVTVAQQRHVRRAAPLPDGIDYVIVNGSIVVDGGEHTGALPGRVVRR